MMDDALIFRKLDVGLHRRKAEAALWNEAVGRVVRALHLFSSEGDAALPDSRLL